VTYGLTCSSAPLWWTPQHDLKFLKLLVKYGPQWKVILEDSEASNLPHSLLEPEPSFVVPSRAPDSSSDPSLPRFPPPSLASPLPHSHFLSEVIMMMDTTRLSARFNVLVFSLQAKKTSSTLTFSRSPSANSSSNGDYPLSTLTLSSPLSHPQDHRPLLFQIQSVSNLALPQM
jgi:hypothetical protein